MAYILNIDTTTNWCSVSLAENGKLISTKETNKGMSHSTKLSVFIDEILKENNLTTGDLAAIAVSTGPGSYTGLRIGVSTAKGICFGKDIPLISISTLQALAYACANKADVEDGVVCPMLDARRMEVYSAIYDIHNNCLQKDEAVIVDESSYQEFLKKGKVYFCANGSAKTKEILTHENANFVENIDTSANNMVTLSWKKFVNKEFEDLAYYEPFYLKSFVAGKPKKLL
jgi:tRNA threonylcarbamoyladenosine biosynthesis protein TsaB